jgi:histidinol dehydrogenase
MQRHDWKSMDAASRERLMSRPAVAADARLRGEAARIVERVRSGGDAALRELTQSLDGVRLSGLAVEPGEFRNAERALTAAQKEAIRVAAGNIEAFHRAQLPSAVSVEPAAGVRCERIVRPIERVGLYVPAGSAPLPSTALLLGVRARRAGAPTRVLCSPPQADGTVDAAVLYAAQVCDIRRVFKIGGAQAIAAMAYGTESVPKVDKVFGPGNAWVAAAKALAAEDPRGAARDLPAGPSEVMVIADAAADAGFVASDLLSQAEHGPDSQAILVTPSVSLAERVLREVEAQTPRLGRRNVVERALENSSAIIVEDLATAFEVANRYAPEHLILQIDEPRTWLDSVRAAGSVFLGPWTPEAIGDYCSGTNHVLPTYGYARCYSGLGVADFLRSMTVQELSPAGLRGIGPVAQTLATLERLDAHAEAVGRRLRRLEESPS